MVQNIFKAAHRVISYTILCMLLSSACLSQIDVNGDGAVEIIYSVEQADTSLEWFALEPTSQQLFGLGTFGISGDMVNFNFWSSSAAAEVASVKRLPRGVTSIFSQTSPSSFPLDVNTFPNKVTLGIDLDGNTLADAAILVKEDRKWQWRIVLNPLSEDNTRYQLVRFQSTQFQPFFLRMRGKRDQLAVLRKRGRRNGALVTRPLKRRRIRRRRMKVRIPAGVAPEVVSAGRRDFLLFSENQRVVVVDSRGRQIIAQPKPFPGPVYPIFVQGNLSVFQMNDKNNLQDIISGTVIPLVHFPINLVQEQSRKDFSGEEVSSAVPTLSPENPQLEVPTIIPPLPLATYTPLPTLTPLPTHTPFPTYTPAPTSTATITPVPVQPTNTPVTPADIPFAHEGFSAGVYVDGQQIVGKGVGSGIGFGGNNWTGSTEALSQLPDFTYSDGSTILESGGLSMLISGVAVEVERRLASVHEIQDSETLFMSFLARSEARSYAGGDAAYLELKNREDETLFWLGHFFAGAEWEFRANGIGTDYLTNEPIVANEINLVVIKITWDTTGGQELVEMWNNPTIGVSPPPAEASFSVNLREGKESISKAKVVLSGPTSKQFEVDELRLGNTWSSVLPQQ